MQAVVDAGCSRCRPGLWATTGIMGMDGVAVRQQQQQWVVEAVLDNVSPWAITVLMGMDVWMQPLCQCRAVSGSG